MSPKTAQHITRDSYPSFLNLLDLNPERAATYFHEFVWKLLLSSPPPRFRSLTQQDREDIIADLVYRWIQDDFRVLRNYKDTGRPFAGYVAVAANNRATDRLRRLQGEKRRHESSEEADGNLRTQLENLPGGGPDPESTVESSEVLEKVTSCVEKLSERCQVLLHGAGDGLKPRELVTLLGWPAEWNKKAHDALRECRRSLQRCLEKQHGIELLRT